MSAEPRARAIEIGDDNGDVVARRSAVALPARPKPPPLKQGRRLRACHSIDDLRRTARRELPRMVFDFIDGAAQTESTAHANRTALDRYRLLPTAPVDVAHRTAAVTLFGETLSMPVIIGPTGYAGAFWPKGDVALARAAGRAGIPFVVSNGANASLAEIANAAEGRVWLQHYLPVERARTLNLLADARAVGVEALEVTVDTAVPGRRGRDLTNGFTIPFSWSLDKVLDILIHPGWLLRALPHGAPRPGLMDIDVESSRWETISDFMATQINPSVTWDDLKWLRDRWSGPLIVKGSLDPQQVAHALSAGFDGVIVSNHGGRQLDGAVATIDVLGEFVAAAEGKIPILIDSGFRSGTDVLRAMALGAGAVQIGRAALYGLAAGGEAGVERALSILHTELDIAMALTGLTRFSGARPDLIRHFP